MEEATKKVADEGMTEGIEQDTTVQIEENRRIEQDTTVEVEEIQGAERTIEVSLGACIKLLSAAKYHQTVQM